MRIQLKTLRPLHEDELNFHAGWAGTGMLKVDSDGRCLTLVQGLRRCTARIRTLQPCRQSWTSFRQSEAVWQL